MTQESITLTADHITGRGGSVNPFLILNDAAGFITFAEQVFGAIEDEQARTATPSEKLIHAEVRLGDSLLLLSDALEGWHPHPGLFQVWVADAEQVVNRAVDQGATVVTPATPFYGSVLLARVQDPWGNLWWLYQPMPGQADPKPSWEGGSDTVFRTLDEHLRSISQQPT